VHTNTHTLSHTHAHTHTHTPNFIAIKQSAAKLLLFNYGIRKNTNHRSGVSVGSVTDKRINKIYGKNEKEVIYKTARSQRLRNRIDVASIIIRTNTVNSLSTN